MVRPAVRRELVAWARAAYGLSERRACVVTKTGHGPPRGDRAVGPGVRMHNDNRPGALAVALTVLSPLSAPYSVPSPRLRRIHTVYVLESPSHAKVDLHAGEGCRIQFDMEPPWSLLL